MQKRHPRELAWFEMMLTGQEEMSRREQVLRTEEVCTAPGTYPRPPACSKLLFTQYTSLQNLKLHKFLRILSTSERKASIKPVQFRPLHSATNATTFVLDSSARWRKWGCWTAIPFSTLTADSTAPLGSALAPSLPLSGSLFREKWQSREFKYVFSFSWILRQNFFFF